MLRRNALLLYSFMFITIFYYSVLIIISILNQSVSNKLTK